MSSYVHAARHGTPANSGGVIPLSGLHSDAPMLKKYQQLFSYIRANYGESTTVVDSSKSLETLRLLLANPGEIGLAPDAVSVIYTVKDVRSFTASMIKKQGASKSLLSILRTFNYWLGANRSMFDFINASDISVVVNLYEEFCFDPARLLTRVFPQQHPNADKGEELSHCASHIAMGNKDFVLRNRQRVRYDTRWFLDDKISAAYLLHHPARRFNRQLYDQER